MTVDGATDGEMRSLGEFKRCHNPGTFAPASEQPRRNFLLALASLPATLILVGDRTSRESQRDKRKVHDDIVGLMIAVTAALGYFGSELWLLVSGALGVVLLQSGITGFCPLYYTLNKIQPEH